MKKSDEFWMRKCLTLARKGIGSVSPNPLVGAIIVKNNKKIGEGYHRQYGAPHAEINAINNALQRGHDISESTIYINLEPCFHYGHTPPCVDAIIKNKFSRVVIAMIDPNPLIAGKSVKKLLREGIECTVGVLKGEAERLNEKFIKYITTGIPFVALKVAQTSDGFIAKSNGNSRWITNALSRKFAHQLRAEYDAVLVGANTVKSDNPKLTVRNVKGRNPIRIVVDGNLSISGKPNVLNNDAATILFTSKKALRKNTLDIANNKKISIVALKSKSGKLKISDILKELGKRKIASVLVEGGSKTYAAFLRENSVDKIYLFTAKKKFGTGVKAFSTGMKLPLHYKKKRKFGSDTLTEIYLRK